MLQGATMQQLQQVQVQSQGTPITVNTHAFICAIITLLETTARKTAAHEVCPARQIEACRSECRMRSDGFRKIL